MISSAWLQQLLAYEVTLAPPPDNRADIVRTIIDGTLIVYDPMDPPAWLQVVLRAVDENGSTDGDISASFEVARALREQSGQAARVSAGLAPTKPRS